MEQDSRADGGQEEKPRLTAQQKDLLLAMGLGFAVGAVVILLVGAFMWSFNVLHIGAVSCPDSKAICAATASAIPACPTCEVVVTVPSPTHTPTPTETPTATPDIRATATAACEAFEDEFPGTPCPTLQPTATLAP